MEKKIFNNLKQNLDQQTLFLTASVSFNPSKLQSYNHQQELQSNSFLKNQLQTLRKQILNLTLQIKNNYHFPQIKNIFYDIFNSLQERNNINTLQIFLESIKTQKNSLKLKRLLNQLKNLKKVLQRIDKKQIQSKNLIGNSVLQMVKYEKNQKVNKKQKNSRFQIKQLSRTLPNQNKNKQKQQLKKRINQQIFYRQRIEKLKSSTQKHIWKRKEHLLKKVQKLKQMNKKAHEVCIKSKVLKRQKLSSHKYEPLFDPEEIELHRIKRGKTMNNYRRHEDSSQIQYLFDVKDENENNPFVRQNQQDSSHSKKQGKNYTKNDLITFKSLKDMYGENAKGSKSFKNITHKSSLKVCFNQKNQYQLNPKSNNFYFQFSNKKQLQLDNHERSLFFNYKSKSKSHSQKKNLPLHKNHDCIQNTSNLSQHKILNAKEKKQALEKEQFAKVITQAIQKELKIQSILNRKYSQAKFKNHTLKSSKYQTLQPSKDHSLHQSIVKSLSNQKYKSVFKRVIPTKKQLLNKQRKLFMKIQDKIQNKNVFLQNRVNKVREKLKKQNQYRQKYKQSWNQYISFTQNLSLNQSHTRTPINLNNLKSNKENKKNSQQFVIKNFHQQNLKRQKNLITRQKLGNLSLNELKKQLIQLQTLQNQQNSLNKNKQFH